MNQKELDMTDHDRGRLIAATVRHAIEQVHDPELRAKLEAATGIDARVRMSPSLGPAGLLLTVWVCLDEAWIPFVALDAVDPGLALTPAELDALFGPLDPDLVCPDTIAGLV